MPDKDIDSLIIGLAIMAMWVYAGTKDYLRIRTVLKKQINSFIDSL
ncbi:MAG: hypothetical protein ACLKAK_06900 [Alkaliphilus sp.]